MIKLSKRNYALSACFSTSCAILMLMVGCKSPYDALVARESGFRGLASPISPSEKTYLGHHITGNGDSLSIVNSSVADPTDVQNTYRNELEHKTDVKFTITVAGDSLPKEAFSDTATLNVTPHSKVSTKFEKPFIVSTEALIPKKIMPPGQHPQMVIEELHTGSHTLKDEKGLGLSVAEKEASVGVDIPLPSTEITPGDLVAGIRLGSFEASEPRSFTLTKNTPVDLFELGKSIQHATLSFEAAHPASDTSTLITLHLDLPRPGEKIATDSAELAYPLESVATIRRPAEGLYAQGGYKYSFQIRRQPGSNEDFAIIPIAGRMRPVPFVNEYLLIRHDANIGDGPHSVKITAQLLRIKD